MITIAIGRRSAALAAVTTIAVGGLLVAAPVAAPAVAGTRCAAGTTLGVMGPFSGPNHSFGLAISHGAELAVARHNAANPACAVRVVRADSQGDPSKAPGAARTLLNNAKVLGVISPVFSGEAQATGASFARARLVTLTPSATNPTLSTHHWATFFRGAASDKALGVTAARFLTSTLHRSRVCVVSDGSDYGATAASAVSHALGKRRVCGVTLNDQRPNYKAATRTAATKHADAVFFAGYDTQAAPMVKQLRAGRSKATFVTDDGAKSSLFVKQAGTAAAGAYVVGGTAPSTINRSLAAQYRKAYRATIPAYAAEGYDAANVQLRGIDHGVTTRAAMLNWVHRYNGQEITQRFRFGSTGELVAPNAWVYVVRKGSLAFYRRVS